MPRLTQTYIIPQTRKSGAYSTPLYLALTERGTLLSGTDLDDVVSGGVVKIRRSFETRADAVVGAGTLVPYVDPREIYNASYISDATDPDEPGMYMIEVDVGAGLTYPDGPDHAWIRIIEDVG